MSFGDLIQDAAAWVTEEIRKSIDDLTDETPVDHPGRSWPASTSPQHYRQVRAPRPVTKVVPLDALVNWQESKLAYDDLDSPTHLTPDLSTATHTPTNYRVPESKKPADDPLPFRVNSDVNKHLFIYEGDICSLRTDCLMCFTADGFSGSDELSARLLSIGGEDLYTELSYQDVCRAGEARICRSFNLPSTHIAYTVTPRFTNRYVTATHNALNASIREVFIALKESRLRSIAISCLSPRLASIQRNDCRRIGNTTEADPNAAAALGGEYAVMHTCLRSIRRWMEKMVADVDAVVLVLGCPSDAAIYKQFIPAYFPRDRAEELDASFLLPREVGNANGEIDVAERRIRLIAKNESGAGAPAADREAGTTQPVFGGMLARQEKSDDEGDSDSDHDILDSNDVSFRVAKAETETEKRLDVLNIKRHGLNHSSDSSETLYQTYLRQANLLADSAAGAQLQQLQFIYPSGHDNAGRPIIVFLAAVFPAATVDSYILLLHIIRTLDPFIRDKYTLLYVNSAVHHSNAPSMTLWSEFFGMMEKFEDNLDQLLVLHPGLLFKAAFTCCWPYLASHVWNGTVYLKSIKELSVHAGNHMPKLPNYVVEYDAKPKTKILGVTL
ncbi:Appr-1-p processing enzyme family domain-containing protein, putative [Eimeria tenella]|uniref:Appr-1-p processing enzyme family domain-containing protein, putative n=1 Tax=Eimeria tenella TaxID=5802 RepID=U6L2W5_EIMTE|nr:Appr-1-p processing enzyme family domain-containing protein, putative [Eimeria tenella]CDJ42115.1 Appr-1-p processing enzyme family domain-containing protein, putative [Eimeria tenella]|eukprot:XP_013232865.1 Appr-1-p processing enzyme family domain-containing protein, putative [Eimeria tenella]